MNAELSNLADIDDEAGFRHFDLRLTEGQHETLAKIRVNSDATYDNFGDVGNIEAALTSFFEGQGNLLAAAREQAAVVTRIIERTIAGFGSESAWITMRASQPTDAFNVPRWHIDGRYYQSEGVVEQVKAVIALKGEGTLLNRLPPEKRGDFMEALGADVDEMECRRRCAELIAPTGTEVTPPGCGTVFIVGSERAAVHSEPPITCERLFLSILPGTKEQIEELRQNWGYAKKAKINAWENTP